MTKDVFCCWGSFWRCCFPIENACINCIKILAKYYFFLPEVYLALQSGTIDGQDNPLQATMNYGFGEVTKSITMTNHVIDINWLSISEEIWQSFDEETKAVFMDGFQIAYDECFAAYDGEEADLIAQFREMGVSVYDDVDISTLKEEVWDYYWAHPEISETWDKDLYDAIQNSAA